MSLMEVCVVNGKSDQRSNYGNESEITYAHARAHGARREDEPEAGEPGQTPQLPERQPWC